ncbi:serine/threonine-protein kinase [Streptomyces sp. AK02-01A]|uniref:serine/threonine-protein kinase n=1 Tax=Streptomyces sp. AK02-01A TaxID=3028648 RepID=UPI0029B27FB2|nr:serine/threonine-protein kinase [Streptomyces sp. AK02-01A]MDX3850876.1 serine/threonine-protein kinase [Streptomyces sp. AK02-01A]
MPPLRNTGQAPEAECPEYAGRYLLESDLGSGGMGVVHLATSASGLRLAVKVIHANHASDPEFRARFKQEIAAARRVSGAFTAPVVDADPEAERPWMATLFIDGPTLSERVKRNGPLQPDEVIRLGAGLAEGLRDIHRAGVVHRDLKPSNVLLAADGPKVIDFGISRPTDSDLRTETGKLIGTPPFMAPEQFQRPREVGPAADVFALGAVLVHAATGRGPFDSDSPYVVAYQVVHDEPDLAGVPESLVPLVTQCLAKDPAERPTPDDLMATLRPSPNRVRSLVPAQRGPVPAEPSATTRPRASRAPTVNSPAAIPRRARWVTVGVVLAALAGAGFIGAQAAGTGDAPGGGHPDTRAGQKFHPWHTSLRAGIGANAAPACSTAGSAVYCTTPGITAARFDQLDGRTDWILKDGRSTSGAEKSMAPVLAGGLLHAVAPGGTRLEALDPASGRKRWDVDIAPYAAVQHLAGSVLLVTSDGLVRSLDSSTGAERWTRRQGGTGSVWMATTGAAGPLFVATPTADATATDVGTVDPRTGETLWVKRVRGTLTPVDATGDALFLLSRGVDDATDAVVRVDSSSRAVRRVPLAVPLDQAQATVAGDTVYVLGYTGSLLAIDTRASITRSAQRWRLETSVTLASRPVAAGNRVYLSAADGRLLAVDRERGVLLGQTKPRMANGPNTLIVTLPAPVTAPGKVFASAPDGSVFAVDSRDPARW